MSEPTLATLENLRLTLHGLTAPFSCEGAFVPDSPVTIVFKDKARVEIIRATNSFEQENELKTLLEHCKPAPFGHRKKTRYDRTVRDALQVNADKGGFTVEHFDPESAGVLKLIQQGLVPHDPNPISAELYTLNVYTGGGHFAPHKDTPRGNDMFGTLVVCLPAQFSHGNLVLNHRGVVQSFDWGEAIRGQKEPNQLHWAAFFGDVDHQIESVWSGVRVTLTYLLRRGSGGAPRETAGEDLAPLVQEAWQALLADPTFLPNGGILGYPCCHLYHQDARFQEKQSPITHESVTMLKGRDHLAAATALQAKLKVTFHPYMFETCAEETWQLDRFPTPSEQKKLRSRMDSDRLHNTLPILASSEEQGDFGVTWIDPPPVSSRISSLSETDEHSELPAAVLLHSCEYSPYGYFGNEGSEIDLYTFAALHITIPKFGQGVRRDKKPAKPTTVKRERSTRKRKTDQDDTA